jgi:hypothetical protein
MRYLSAHGARRGTIDEIFPNFQIYRDVWKTAGHPGEGEVYVRDPVYVGDTVDQALSNPEDSLRERPFALVRQMIAVVRFWSTLDSPLEGTGFEPLVPPDRHISGR